MLKKRAPIATLRSARILHFEIMPSDQGDPQTRRDEIIITEITQWFREAVSVWTTANLGQFASYRNGYGGSMQGPPTRVRVYGWLFYDDPHSGDGSVGTWRGTAWEIHPVTRIEVFENVNWREIPGRNCQLAGFGLYFANLFQLPLKWGG
jgi:hypothetical protein